MATATSRLRLIKQAYNENIDSHGLQLNTGALDMTDEAFGVKDIAVAANVTLSVEDYLTDESRHLVLVFTGAGGFTVTHPAVDKPYLVINDCAAAVTLQPDGGTGASIGAGQKYWYYTNDAGTVGYFISRRLDELEAPTAALDLNSQKIENLADATAANDAVNKGQLDSASFSSALPAASTDKDMAIWNHGASQYQARQLVVDDISDYAFASQAEAEAGTATDKPLNALRTKQAIDALTPTPETGLVPLSTTTISSAVAAVDFTANIDSTYDEYIYKIYNLKPVTDSVSLYVRTSTDGGSTFDAGSGNYSYGMSIVFHTSSASYATSSSATHILCNTASYPIGNTTNEEGWSGEIRLLRPSHAQYTHIIVNGSYITSSAGGVAVDGSGYRKEAADVDAIRLLFSSGNIDSGVIHEYGVKKPT